VIVRVSLMRQKNWQKAAHPLPDCLADLIEQHVLHYEKVDMHSDSWTSERQRLDAPMFDSDKVLPPDAYLMPYHVRKMATIHMSDLRKIFRKWAVTDELRDTMNLEEYTLLLEAAGPAVLGSDLTRTELLEAVGITMLCGDPTFLEEWMEVATSDPPSLCIIFEEFVDCIARAAFTKYRDDPLSKMEFKAHELWQLLISGPASKAQPPPRPPPEPPPEPPAPPEPEKKPKKKSNDK